MTVLCHIQPLPPPPTAQHHLRPNLLTDGQARELARGEEVELGDEEGGGGGHWELVTKHLNGWLCDIEIAKKIYKTASHLKCYNE